MNEHATIILPLPDGALSQNRPTFSRGGRISQAVKTKAYRAAACSAAQALDLQTTPWAKTRATLAFFFERNLRRDIRNFEARMKAGYDGLVDAGVLADDDARHLSHGPTTFGVDKAHPRVEITVERLA